VNDAHAYATRVAAISLILARRRDRPSVRLVINQRTSQQTNAAARFDRDAYRRSAFCTNRALLALKAFFQHVLLAFVCQSQIRDDLLESRVLVFELTEPREFGGADPENFFLPCENVASEMPSLRHTSATGSRFPPASRRRLSAVR
jgi:hypothetical protein